MHDDDPSLCEFNRYVDELVANHERGRIVVATPIFCGPLPVNAAPKIKLLVRHARACRAWFARHGPCWAQPLPLHQLERINFFISDSLPLHLVALYARSLQGRDFDYLTHPQLFDYCRAVMADPRTREYLREDPGLRAEFPAKPIAGLDAQGRWRPLPNRTSQLFEDLLVS
jgi:hypothetical protein